jgi:thioredoxin 1
MIRILIGALIGAGIGAGVGYLGRCSGGSCPLTCNPIGGMLAGAIIGVILVTSAGRSASVAAAESSANVVEIRNAEQFDKTVAGGGVVLVDFYADWCAPCMALKPAIQDAADKYAGKAAVLAVNVDKLGEFARRHGISSIPDVRLFNGGKQVEHFIGLQSKETYEAAIEKALGENRP